MIYSKFSVDNFRCFKTQQTLEFAIPDDEKLGSGLTYIVGANNSGKTSVLEAMQFKKGSMLNNTDQPDRGVVSSFEYYDERGNICRKLQNELGHYLLNPLDGLPADQDTLPYFVPSRRHWYTRVQHTGNTDKLWIIEQSQLSRMRMSPEHSIDLDVAGLLRGIENNVGQYSKLTDIMHRLIPDFDGYACAFDEYEYIECKSGDDKYKSSYSGEGIASLLRIVANIMVGQNKPVVIDEPELSLHPLAKRRLAEWLGELSKSRQIIIATHDPYFVSWDYIVNGAKVNHLVKDLGNTTINHLNNFAKYESFIQTGHNWQKPQMMDLLSKEIFFCDNILFLEGQQDVGLLRTHKFIDENIINIFDYGIGGISFAEPSLVLAKDLGLKKVAIVLDGGRQETDIANNLRGKYRDYRVIQWNKMDIRDKRNESNGELVKEGYFNEDGELKNREQLDDFYEKLQEINEYFRDSTQN